MNQSEQQTPIESDQDERDREAAQILDLCRKRGLFLACAESLTAGLLSDAFVRISGASDVFLGSAVTYTNEEKESILGVDKALLDTYGAVHPQVARQMAHGASRLYSAADKRFSNKVIGLSTTGVAGPGPDGDKPAGLVYIACALPYGPNHSKPGIEPMSDESDKFGSRRSEIQYEDSLRSRAWVSASYIRELRCQGDRQQVREQTVSAVLRLVLDQLSGREKAGNQLARF